MIVFLTTLENSLTIDRYLQKYGAALADFVRPATYERLFDVSHVPSGVYFFTDLELLNDRGRELATRAWQQLADHGCRMLNHPQRTLRRYELLRMLHQRGINQFNVYRLAEQDAVQRFPVFLRHEHQHTGSKTELLRTPAELAAAIAKLRRSDARLENLLITEYYDTADADGIYRKYGAFIVGDKILARHLFISKQWEVKEWDLLEQQFLLEEQRYVDESPHEQQLREIFAAAHVDYGRIDYSLLGDKLQVWEINTNPIIVGQGNAAGGVREPVHARFSDRFQAVMNALNG